MQKRNSARSDGKPTTTRAAGRRRFVIPEVLEDEERRALLSQPNPRYPTGLRNLAMMQLMLDAGLRVSEVINLQTTDIHWISGRIHIHQGKGSKDRKFCLNEQTRAMLERWRQRRQRNAELLFTTLAGGKLSDRYMRTMVKRYAKKAGIKKSIHPHTLRHSFATDLYRQTKDIRKVQKILGHADLSTTMIYTHLADEDLENTMRNFRSEKSA